MKVIFENVTKKFGNFTAVDNLNVKFKDGEFVALLGPSGCGKTTTLLMIAGIYKPSSGKIMFDDKVMNDVLPKNRNIGMCFQSYALYPHMTVFENIAFPLKLKKMSKDEIKKRVMQAANKVEIGHLLDRKPGQLSGGQQQRVSLARALVKEPQIMLLDEPLSNLDARLRINMRAEIKKLQKDLGINMVLVTHDQTEALTMADRIAIMNNGKLQDFDIPEELYENPKNLFIANFIGNPPMNFIDVELVEEEGKYFVKNEVIKLELPESSRERFDFSSCSKQLVLGIRPEDLTITESKCNTLQAEIYVVEPLGRDKLVNVVIGERKYKIIAPPKFNADTGDKVNISLNFAKIHLFDKTSEGSIRRNRV
ncbi:ABC-type sugar transport system ATPase subunit [Desulfohalotomaculum tongense]|uniref:ABC transporter ATP-binding protein n=1 Tax=Desulforadius tongensis TaxID=1216062 RepID=UPI001EE4F803|nr:ABC transporter ATP-binding protein [Desulforadius tongensis]MBM7854841.1 ABC-type sugar transport system ATPase subunit [Desulforadius tongensis]